MLIVYVLIKITPRTRIPHGGSGPSRLQAPAPTKTRLLLTGAEEPVNYGEHTEPEAPESTPDLPNSSRVSSRKQPSPTYLITW